MGLTPVTMNKQRVTTSNGFKRMNEWAVSNGMNRAANKELMSLIDDYGFHVGIPIMVHNHRQGVEVEPHFRIVWHVKTEEYDETGEHEIVTMDIEPELFQLCTMDVDEHWMSLSVPELKFSMVLVMDEIERRLTKHQKEVRDE